MGSVSRSRFILIKLFLLGIMACGMILGAVVWLTARIDTIERENGEKLVQLVLTEQIAQVSAVVNDYAHWDSAAELFTSDVQDSDVVYSDFGSAAAEDGIFSHIVFLATDETPLYFFDETGAVEAFDLTAFQPFLTKLRLTSPKEQISVEGVAAFEGGYGAAAVTYITPSDATTLADGPMPVMIGIKMFFDDDLRSIVQLAQGTDHVMNPSQTSMKGSKVPLIGPDGVQIAELHWTPSKVGSALRNELIPGILIICAGIFGICFSAATYFYRQSKSLEEAVLVAKTDRLTGLLNRAGLEDVLRNPATRTRLEAGNMAVLYIDLNDFKMLNDAHGHKIGDLALGAMARCLKTVVRPQDHVVRLGGDEFICLVSGEDPEAAVQSISIGLLAACSMPIKLGDTDVALSPAIGFAVAVPGVSWEDLLAKADAAMFQAKRRKRNFGAALQSLEVSERVQWAG